MFKISTEKSFWDPFLLHTIELKQIVAVLQHVKRRFLVELHRSKFIAVSVYNGLCVVNAKDVVHVPEMPLPLTLFNLYMKQCDQNVAFGGYTIKILDQNSSWI